MISRLVNDVFELLEMKAGSLDVKLSVKNETELIGEELRLASSAISDITSIVNIEEILDEIFSKFCIGK